MRKARGFSARRASSHRLRSVARSFLARFRACKTESGELPVQGFVPGTTCLLETIEGPFETPAVTGFNGHTIRRHEVQLLIQLTIEVGSGDIHLIELQVIACSEGKDDAHGLEVGDRGKDVLVVNARLLSKASSHNADLEALDATILVELDTEDRLGCDWLHT